MNSAIEHAPSRGTIKPQPSSDFIFTEEVAAVTDRAMTYLRVGYPVHLAGPAGTGKTTLAFHIAAQLGRPVSLIHGNHEFGTSDLIGKDSGYSKSYVMDNFITSVVKTEEKLSVNWKDNRLTTACEQGHVLIYDEFNRTPPEANNILLSILEEGILNLPKLGGDAYTRVHPEFRVIFTSNPEEYAGVHQTQDALLDRLITVPVHHYDRATEEAITAARGGVSTDRAAMIVAIARRLRQATGNPHRPTIRACIALAKVTAARDAETSANDRFFVTVCAEIFGESARAAVEPPSMDEWSALIGEVAGGTDRPIIRRRATSAA